MWQRDTHVVLGKAFAGQRQLKGRMPTCDLIELVIHQSFWLPK